MGRKSNYTIEKIPTMRRFAMDAGYLGRRRHIVHGLIEVDVTTAREYIRRYEQATGTRLSFTAYVIHCLSQAIEGHPHLHAYRDWRNRLVIYEDINITSMFEVEVNGRKVPMAHVFKNTNRKTFLDLHRELRDFQQQPRASEEFNFSRLFPRLPAFMRRAFYWIVMRFPQSFREHASPVMVTAVGMFGTGGGWALTMPNFTLNIAVGGIARKPGVVDDQILARDYLGLTISVDHDIVDGAPAARFVQSYRTLLEQAASLDELAEITDPA